MGDAETEAEEALLASGADLRADAVLEKHAAWVEEIKTRRTFSEENAMDILLEETGRVFAAVLEDAGVYKCTKVGRSQFLSFLSYVNQEM